MAVYSFYSYRKLLTEPYNYTIHSDGQVLGIKDFLQELCLIDFHKNPFLLPAGDVRYDFRQLQRIATKPQLPILLCTTGFLSALKPDESPTYIKLQES